MTRSNVLQELKIRFVAKLGVSGKYDKDGLKKFHVMIPRQYTEELDKLNLEGKQVKITLEDEF